MYKECGQTQLLFGATFCLHGPDSEIKTKHINTGYRGVHSLLNEQSPIGKISKFLFQKQGDQLLVKGNYPAEEKKKYNDRERQEVEFQKRVEKRRKKANAARKTK